MYAARGPPAAVFARLSRLDRCCGSRVAFEGRTACLLAVDLVHTQLRRASKEADGGRQWLGGDFRCGKAEEEEEEEDLEGQVTVVRYIEGRPACAPLLVLGLGSRAGAVGGVCLKNCVMYLYRVSCCAPALGVVSRD